MYWNQTVTLNIDPNPNNWGKHLGKNDELFLPNSFVNLIVYKKKHPIISYNIVNIQVQNIIA